MRTSISARWMTLLVCVLTAGAWSLAATAETPDLRRGSPRCSQSDPGSLMMSVSPGKAIFECLPQEGGEDRRIRASSNGDAIVDAAGIRSGGPQTAGSGLDANGPGLAAIGVDPLTNTVTIDKMTTAVSFGYAQSHSPGAAISVLGSAAIYFLSDGSQWSSGAGSYHAYGISLDHVETSGDALRYVMVNPGNVYQQTDYDSGDHSAQGTLAAEGPVVLETTVGSNIAILRGGARVVSNDATYYGDRFNYYSALVGSVVPFQVTYTLTSGTWDASIFGRSFSYTAVGWVDFAHPIASPQVQSLTINGSAQVPSQSTIQFRATATFDGGVLRDVTNASAWSAEPAAIASISQGLLTTQAIAGNEQTLTLHAVYTVNGSSAQADKTVIVKPGGSVDDLLGWEMYQGDPKHTGFVPIALDPEAFSLRWQRAIGSGYALNPVTAADGKVFVSLQTYFNNLPSLFALDARDGETLWSKTFGSVFSVNPPSYGYGNVYVQTGNHSTDTWLWAFDATTGTQVFKSPHQAQWESYFAPTIDSGTVFVNGGYYGGMYAFDAFSGEQKWFLGLPQYDEWTPAVDAGYAYAYVGDYSPGVYAANRSTGASAFTIPDPNFDWNGWSMDLAPVLGGRDDLLAIHNGRLLSFNLPARSIRYQLTGAFVGQPSVAEGTIYAINGGALVALDEASGTALWAWSPPEPSLQGALIVTKTHIFGTTSTTTYAVDRLSHTLAWSYPAAGSLALGNETLYIASSGGVLTAISMPEYSPASVSSLEISGPAQVVENSSAQFRAMVHYTDGRVRERTALAQFTVDPATYASFANYGVMNVTELLDLRQDVVVHARYTEGAATVEATLPVSLVIGVTTQQFLERNIQNALAAKRQILELLRTAQAGEDAVQRAAGTPPPSAMIPLVNDVRHALDQERLATSAIQRSIDDLTDALSVLGPQSPHTRPAKARKLHGGRELVD